MEILTCLAIWLVGCFVAAGIMRPLEVGYGVVTVFGIVVWTIAYVVSLFTTFWVAIGGVVFLLALLLFAIVAS